MGTPLRSNFLYTALGLTGTPYLWGGKNPAHGGLDCSGLVTHSYFAAGGPDWRNDHNAESLFVHLEETEAPKAGTLCFYGPTGRATHVMVWLGACGLVFGATGGDHSTTSLDAARARDAKVKLKTSHLYRPDFLGWRNLPFPD